jgi:hypothetical protein
MPKAGPFSGEFGQTSDINHPLHGRIGEKWSLSDDTRREFEASSSDE